MVCEGVEAGGSWSGTTGSGQAAHGPWEMRSGQMTNASEDRSTVHGPKGGGHVNSPWSLGVEVQGGLPPYAPVNRITHTSENSNKLSLSMKGIDMKVEIWPHSQINLTFYVNIVRQYWDVRDVSNRDNNVTILVSFVCWKVKPGVSTSNGLRSDWVSFYTTAMLIGPFYTEISIFIKTAYC